MNIYRDVAYTTLIQLQLIQSDYIVLLPRHVSRRDILISEKENVISKRKNRITRIEIRKPAASKDSLCSRRDHQLQRYRREARWTEL